MKTKERQKALELRAQGLTLKQIAKQLSISKGTASHWCRHIKLTPEQISNIKNKAYQNQLKGAQVKKERAKNQRLEYQEEGKIQAKKMDPLHIKGCMLYWAEGSKNKNVIEFCNTNVHMMKLFIKFLKKYFNISKDKIKLTITCYTNNNLSIKDIEKYWITNLNLPNTCTRKHNVNNQPRSASGKEGKKKYPYGCARISIGNTQAVQHIFGAIQEYGGFDNQYCVG